MSKFTRRLQKIGSSILVSLPKQWVDDHKLEKSSQVQIETLENSLSITAGEGKKLSKEIEIEYPLSGEENIAVTSLAHTCLDMILSGLMVNLQSR